MSTDEKEILLRAIDVLTMENLRLNRENEALKITNQTLAKHAHHKRKSKQGPQIESLWTKGINYLKREGFWKTTKKVFAKLTGH